MSTPEEVARRELIASSFETLSELDTADRAAALESLAPDVRSEVVSLLSALERKGDLLEARHHGLDEGGDAPRVGAYRLVRRVGRGGMGAVFEAVRADASFVMRVAIKLIREDIGGVDVSRRFARERAILAQLEHPNISRMLDGGTLDDGREYLVMEFVDGVPITTWCDSHDADVRKRLALFLQVCDAVQFSHQHLVVHGDIKPSNILVTTDGTAKLVDFGVAKVVDQGDSRTRELLTALGGLTPAYASPEQWRGEALSISSDVYSLGVVLYQLLAGVLPFSVSAMTAQDILTTIETGARPPSVAVLTGEPATPPSEVRRRSRILAGELDTIVLTALESSLQRRYPSVERFAEDIRRYLDGRMVLAQPATRGYRLSKFLKRNRGKVAAGAALALALIGGTTAATLQARRANRERIVAERISSFLERLLAAPDASWVHAGNADVRVADVLDAAAAQADSLRGEPAAEAMVRRTIGAAYRALNRFDDSQRQLERALAIDLARNAPDYPDLADDYHQLGWVIYVRGNWDKAFPYYREAYVRCASRATDTSSVCYQSIADYALGLASRSRLAEADSLYRDVLRRGKLRFITNTAPLAVIYANIGFVADAQGNLSYAESMYRQALASWTSGPQPSERTTMFHSLALNQLVQGNLAAAESLALAGLKCARETNQARGLPASVLNTDLAAARRRRGDASGAAEAIVAARAAIPPNTPITHPTLSNLVAEEGVQSLVTGKPQAAERAFRDAEKSRAVFAVSDPRRARMIGLIGAAVAAQGRYGEADSLLAIASGALDKAFPSSHPHARALRGARAVVDSARKAGETSQVATARVARYAATTPW